MSQLKKLQTTLSDFFFTPADPYVVAILRMSLGLLMFFSFVFLIPNWVDYFSSVGVTSGGADPAWSLFYWFEKYIGVSIFLWLGIAASIGMAIGCFSRTSTILTYLVLASMLHRTPMVANGEDLVCRMLLFYCCFLNMGEVWSIDALYRKKVRTIPGWPLRLLQLNFLGIYVFSLPLKLLSDRTWITGEGMYWGLVNRNWSRFPFPELSYDVNILIRVMTWGSLLLEASLPVLIWGRKTKMPMFYAMVGFHLIIAIVLENVTFFSLSMIAGLTAFLPPYKASKTASATA